MKTTTMTEAMTAAKQVQLPGVHVHATQGSIVISVDTNYCVGTRAAQALVVAAKRDVLAHLISACPDRKFVHMTSRGYRLWRQGYYRAGGSFNTNGWACGISLVRTEAETSAVIRGMQDVPAAEAA